DSALPGSSMHQTAEASSINVSSSNGSSEVASVDHRVIDAKIGGSTSELPSSIKPQVASQADGQTATQEDFGSASFGTKTDSDRLGSGTEQTAAGIKIHKKPMLDPALRERDVIERALQRGDLEAAEEAYRRVLKLKPDDVDAMIGLANIFFNRGLIKQAQNAYFAILNKNPENLFAKVGLINIGVMDPANLAGGSELKQLIIEHPDQHFLHASLGSFYVRRNNWPAAQAAYFEALALDTENPDYAFNLAVSLDQLNKPDIAARYYRSALELIGKQAAGFSESDIRRRLQQLSGDLP
ncbi:MAG: tetratricopeptide repeat protein, partial [Porticoccaceae bacterium]|nr:tetratricopeptide repeat protein [Porticoccaceae bacterium]